MCVYPLLERHPEFSQASQPTNQAPSISLDETTGLDQVSSRSRRRMVRNRPSDQEIDPTPSSPASSKAGWASVISLLSSRLIISNDGSTARDHLGRDRTWMQWIRLSTLLVLVSLTTSINFRIGSDSQDDHDHQSSRFSKQFAVIFISLSVLLVLLGFFEYCSVHRTMSLRRGFVQSGFYSGFMIASVSLILIAFTLMLFFDDMM